jgi:hypothetical protein
MHKLRKGMGNSRVMRDSAAEQLKQLREWMQQHKQALGGDSISHVLQQL